MLKVYYYLLFHKVSIHNWCGNAFVYPLLQSDTTRTGPTIPQPFKVAGKKRKRDLSGDTQGEFKSVAQQIAQFSSRTPERFRVSRKGRFNLLIRVAAFHHLKTTVTFIVSVE